MTSTAPSTTSPTTIAFTIAGLPLALFETVVQPKKGSTTPTGRTYYCFREPNKPSDYGFGVQISALDVDLPTSVEVDGVEFTTTLGKTAASFKRPVHVIDETTGKKVLDAKGKPVVKLDDKGKAVYETVIVPEDERRASVTYTGNTTLPSLGDERTLKVTISETKDGQWNVRASVTKVYSVSPEDRKVAAKAKADTNLAAILAALGRAA
jgi:hypothetical protein